MSRKGKRRHAQTAYVRHGVYFIESSPISPVNTFLSTQEVSRILMSKTQVNKSRIKRLRNTINVNDIMHNWWLPLKQVMTSSCERLSRSIWPMQLLKLPSLEGERRRTREGKQDEHRLSCDFSPLFPISLRKLLFVNMQSHDSTELRQCIACCCRFL